MKITKIFYLDDDADDIEIFTEAADKLKVPGANPLTVKGYTDWTYFLKDLLEPGNTHDAVVFLDVNMPIKNGFDILTEIRRIKDFLLLPVIMYSTSSEPNMLKTSWDLGASMYVVKPSGFKALSGMIRHVLDIDWSVFKAQSGNFVLRKA